MLNISETIADSQRSAQEAGDAVEFWDRVSAITIRCLGAAIVAGVLLTESRAIIAKAGLLLIGALVCAGVRKIQAQTLFRSHSDRMALLSNMEARGNRNWDALPMINIERYCNEPVARDLDVFGEASLFQLVCTAETRRGRATLANWLLNGHGSSDEIQRYQQQVAALSPMLDWRLELQQACRGLDASEIDELCVWTEEARTLKIPRVVFVARWVVPCALFASIACWFFRPVALIGFLGIPIILLVSFLLTVLYSGEVHQLLQRLSVAPWTGRSLPLHVPFSVSASLRGEKTDSLGLAVNSRDAESALTQLNRILLPGNISRNALTAVLLYLPLQFLFQWDLHVAKRLMDWQARNRLQVDSWFSELARLESVASLAGLAFQNSNWAFPEIQSAGNEIRATRLGHPLLPPDECVGNDLLIGPHGRVLLVTGSNMSGKSTLLRAVGLNVLLAQAGGPCCCTVMQLPLTRLATSMRIGDSLQRGQSLFLAELLRLRDIVESLPADIASERVVLFLLDEILHGTNSAERRIAVQNVVAHVKDYAIGAISTHDLELANSPELASVFQHVHFRETLHEADGNNVKMTFDYTLRYGIAPTTNALQLVRMLGLPVK